MGTGTGLNADTSATLSRGGGKEGRALRTDEHERPGGARDRVTAYYAENARVYRVFSHFYDAVTAPLAGLRRDVMRFSGASSAAKVLDVATGTGAQAAAFSAVCREVVGVDISEEMLSVARRKRKAPNVRFERADAVALPFRDATFDVACISFALHEMPAPILQATLCEMTRVLVPDGVVIVVDFAGRRDPLGRLIVRVIRLFEREPYAAFVRSDLRALLETAGVHVEAERPCLLGFARMLRGRRAQPAARSR